MHDELRVAGSSPQLAAMIATEVATSLLLLAKKVGGGEGGGGGGRWKVVTLRMQVQLTRRVR